ncbi:hypothetical protein G5I_00017 [Acromyrmex echinatior]|uniref:Uncharacterized protein n=1 Tax=Acromyrmex echinatior TaxID=103372 RepID=F4W3R9_ACREC|nr:hypothetical protein G5I_00017 [Acromyrmex echinatior]
MFPADENGSTEAEYALLPGHRWYKARILSSLTPRTLGGAEYSLAPDRFRRCSGVRARVGRQPRNALIENARQWQSTLYHWIELDWHQKLDR